MNYIELTNEELVALVQKRDEQAFTCLFNRNLGLAITTANRHLNDFHESEEVAVKVFHQVWNNPEYLDLSNGNKFLAWFVTVLSRRAIDKARSRIAYRAALNRHELSFTGDSAEDQEYVRDFVAIGRKIISRLPKLQRITTELAIEGFTEREIAHKLNKSRSTIHQAIATARSKFKRLTPSSLN